METADYFEGEKKKTCKRLAKVMSGRVTVKGFGTGEAVSSRASEGAAAHASTFAPTGQCSDGPLWSLQREQPAFGILIDIGEEGYAWVWHS